MTQLPPKKLPERTRRSMIRLGTFALLSVLSANVGALSFDAELAYTDDDNVTRSPRKVDVLKDRFVSVSAGMSFLQWLDDHHRLVYRGFLRGEKYDKYDGLSNASLGGQITYQYRASGKFTAPTYGAFFRSAIVEYDSELRDSNLYTLGVSWRQPVTDRVTFFTQLSGNYRDSDSTVFDTKEISLLGNIDYKLGPRWTLYTTYNYLQGDIFSSVDSWKYGALPWVNKFVDAAKAINVDDAFGNGNGNWIAYRLDGKTHVLTLGTNFSVNEQQSLDISARWVDSLADAGISYERWQFSLTYLLRF